MIQYQIVSDKIFINSEKKKSNNGHHGGSHFVNCWECIFITILGKPFVHHVVSVGHWGNSDLEPCIIFYFNLNGV